MAKNMSGSKRLGHGNKGTYRGVDNTKNKSVQAFHEESDLRPHKDKDPGNSRRKHGYGKKGKRKSY